MPTKKKTFIFYSDWINMVREMPNEDAGILLKHVLSYVNEQESEPKSLLVKMAFGHMKPLIDKDLEKWDIIREKRKEYGRKGGLAKANQKLAKANQTEAVNVNVNGNNNTIIKNNTHSIEERKTSFASKIKEVAIQKNIDRDTLNEFYKYWTEHGERDKKMRFEKQKSFNINLRLERWLKNQKTYNEKKVAPKKISLAEKMRIEHEIKI